MGAIGCQTDKGELKRVIKWRDKEESIPYVVYYAYAESLEVIQGEYRLFYPSGKLLEKSFFNDGVPDGEFYTYYESGGLRSKGVNCNGKLCGLRYEYYENGKVREVAEYKDDRLWAIHEVYDSTGGKLDWGSFSEGNGVLIKYHPNGRMSEKGAYVDGRRSGVWRQYALDGTYTMDDQYKDGYLLNEEGEKMFKVY